MEDTKKSNNAVIESLSSLQTYAAQYKDRLGSKSEEQKKKEENFVKTYLQKNKTLSIQEQIAETLRLAKIKEDEKKKLAQKSQKEKEMAKNIARSQLEFYSMEIETIDRIEEDVAQFIADQIKMERDAMETQIIIEREEKKRKEKEELLFHLRKQEEERKRKLALERAKAEQEMKEKIMRELQVMQSSAKKDSSKIKEDEKQKESERLKREKEEQEKEVLKQAEKKRIAELEKRNRVQEEAKKITFLSAMKDFVKQKTIIKKKEIIKESSEQIENNKELKEEAKEQCEKLRIMLEHDRQISIELQNKRKKEKETLALSRRQEDERRAQLYEEVKRLENEKRLKQLEKLKNESKGEEECFGNKPSIERTMLLPLLHKFEQLSKLAKEEEVVVKRVKREKKRLQAKSKSKLLLNKVIASIPKSMNNVSGVNEIKNDINSTKDGMKNYLISHILFDEGEGVHSLEKEATKSQELKIKESQQDNELELESKLFETYKQNMEEYLGIVCEDQKIDQGCQSNKGSTFDVKKIKPALKSTYKLKEMFISEQPTQKEQLKKAPMIKKLTPEQLVFKSQGRKNDQKKAPILIDKQAFQRTLKVFDYVDKDEGNLSDIQEKKNDLIINIREELECLDKNLKDTLVSNNMIVEGRDSCVEADEPLPAWLQLFLERSDSFKTKTEEVEHENTKIKVPPPPCDKESNTGKITEDGDKIENLSQSIDHDKFMIMTTEKLLRNDSIINDHSTENNALKSKISKLKNVFNFPQKSGPPSVHLKVPKYVATCDLKEKFEKPDSDSSNDTSLMKAPPQKLIRVPSFEKNHPLNKEKKNWKWKQESLKVVDDASSSLNGNDEIIPNEFSDVASFNEKATIEKLLELIDDSQSQSQPTEKMIRPSKVGKRIWPLEKCKTQDLFKDQRPLNTPSPMVSKLSRSLSFLNRPDSLVAQKSNNDNELRSNNSSCTEAIKKAFENKVETASSEVMKNRVQKKILESPWSQILDLENSKDVSQEKEIKYWKPKAVPEEPLRMRLTGFPQTTKFINSPDILSEKIEKPSQHITFKRVEVKDENNEDDFDDILNYEDSSEIKEYEKELRARYELDYRGSCDELSDKKSSMKPSNSFSSLMNILTTMRKTRLTRSVSACKLNLLRSSEAENPKKIQDDNFEEILTNKERKANYERATSCQNSKKDLTNPCNEELEEVKLHRKEKVYNPTSASLSDLSLTRSAVDDLDEEVMTSVRQNNKNVKSFFEASAPKYKFGGSMKNISASAAQVRQDQETERKATKKGTTSGDSRSWVLNSINKHFDVIVEDDEDGSDSENSEYESSEDDDFLLENEDINEHPLKVSEHMRNIFKSVVCQITEREDKLNNEDILSNLKRKLDAYTSNS